MQLLTAPLPTANFLKLDSGLTVIHQYLSTTSVVVADVWVNAGAVREPENWYGMAHFLEHMIFKGTSTIRPGEFDRVIENNGGMTNAATSHDYAHYFLTTATAYLADTLPYLADLLLNAVIPEEEFDKERDVVLEEIRSCYDVQKAFQDAFLNQVQKKMFDAGPVVEATKAAIDKALAQ